MEDKDLEPVSRTSQRPGPSSPHRNSAPLLRSASPSAPTSASNIRLSKKRGVDEVSDADLEPGNHKYKRVESDSGKESTTVSKVKSLSSSPVGRFATMPGFHRRPNGYSRGNGDHHEEEDEYPRPSLSGQRLPPISTLVPDTRRGSYQLPPVTPGALEPNVTPNIGYGPLTSSSPRTVPRTRPANGLERHFTSSFLPGDPRAGPHGAYPPHEYDPVAPQYGRPGSRGHAPSSSNDYGYYTAQGHGHLPFDGAHPLQPPQNLAPYPPRRMPSPPAHYGYMQPHNHESSIDGRGEQKSSQCWDHGCNGKNFSTFSNLLRHQREKGGRSQKWVCPNCGAEFTRTTARRNHMENGKCRSRRRSEEK